MHAQALFTSLYMSTMEQKISIINAKIEAYKTPFPQICELATQIVQKVRTETTQYPEELMNILIQME